LKEKLRGEMIVDLHMHSTASDGSYTPKMLIEEVKKAGVELFALTDHDTSENVEEVKTLAVQEGIAFIPGVEISTTLENKMFHVLAYGFDLNDENLQKILKTNREKLIKKDDESIKMLIEEGYELEFEEYLRYEYDPARGGWKTLNFLIDKGIVKDVSDFFGRLFSGDRKVPYPEFENPKKIIEAVKAAKGTAVLAHPFYDVGTKLVEDTFEKFKAMGIEGVECYHPNHSKEATEFSLNWCRKNNMIITAGSDCHGDFIVTRKIGTPRVALKELNLSYLERHVIL